MVAESRSRAKQAGVEYAITAEDVVALWSDQGGRCAISGMPLTHHRRGNQARSLTNASLDRIAPSGPYTSDNVQIVCVGVNLMRRALELDEFITWCRQVADYQARHWLD